MTSSTPPSREVVIVGAGPVGLLLGNLLGQAGIRTLIVEKRSAGPDASMAIGITPPSLGILRELELDQTFVDHGVRVDHALVFGNRQQLGELHFHGLPGPWPFILSLPQAETVRLLEERLARETEVELRRGWELQSFHQGSAGVEVALQAPGGHRESVHCHYLVGCDGRSGGVRSRLGVRSQARDYPQNFLMADHLDTTDLGSAAVLFFTRSGSVESFPLPWGRRRWIVQTDRFEERPETGLLEELVSRRTGTSLDPDGKTFESAFRVSRLLTDRYHVGRVALCGDAAHLMSPVGGQGMNVGFGDARRLAIALTAILRQGCDPAAEFSAYDADRRPAAAAAIARAGRGMGMGTRRGRLACVWREPVLRFLLSPLMRRHLPPYFAMLTLPGSAERARA